MTSSQPVPQRIAQHLALQSHVIAKAAAYDAAPATAPLRYRSRGPLPSAVNYHNDSSMCALSMGTAGGARARN